MTPSTDNLSEREIAQQVMGEMLGLPAEDCDPESRGALLIREGIKRWIAQQTEEVARLREALKKVGSGCTTRPDDIENPTVLWMQDIARTALSEQPGREE